ncbi:MAG TPA: hypothetical protein VFO77_02005 [Actinoplanes sp.]|nr:hypothetical protein [Actinoplanes sp.]
MGPDLMTPSAGPARPYRALAGTVRALAGTIADIERVPDWPAQLRRHLDQLHLALDEHVHDTEGPDGSYTETVIAAPRLARAVSLLADDHRQLCGAVDALRRDLDAGTHPGDLRRCGAWLLVLLDRHRQRGIDLLYQAYGTDLGGET